MPLWAAILLGIFALALLLGIAMGVSLHPPPSPRRPSISRPVPRPSQPRTLPPVAARGLPVRGSAS